MFTVDYVNGHFFITYPIGAGHGTCFESIPENPDLRSALDALMAREVRKWSEAVMENIKT